MSPACMDLIVRQIGHHIQDPVSLICAILWRIDHLSIYCGVCPQPSFPVCGRSRDRNGPFIKNTMKRAKEFEAG